MSDWYVRQHDEVLGPFTSGELLAMVRSGQVTPDTPLQKGDSQWVLAEQVNGLFEAVGQQAVRYHCPSCGEEIHRPPTHCEYCAAYVERAMLERLPVKPRETDNHHARAADQPRLSWWGRLAKAWGWFWES